VLGSATLPAENWNKFNSCWGTFPCKRQSYLGCKQRFREAVNDRIGIEPIG
jgi:hypothetical protein